MSLSKHENSAEFDRPTENNGDHLFAHINAKQMASGTNDDDPVDDADDDCDIDEFEPVNSSVSTAGVYVNLAGSA